MAEDLAAIREARRRKILENSQNRLNKILGVTGKTIVGKENVTFNFTTITLKIIYILLNILQKGLYNYSKT